jgi:putative ABC transport system permease protein
MTVRDRLRGLRVLRAELLRTTLTLLGIVLGSAAIVLVAGIVAGAEVAIVHANQNVTGSDLITVRRRELPSHERMRGRPELDRRDAAALKESWVGDDREVYAESFHEVRASSGTRKKDVRLVSADPATEKLFRLELAQGRFLDETDLSEGRRVCIVGQEVHGELLEGAPLQPDTLLRADGVGWKVIGVLAPKPQIGSTTGTNIWARKVIVPATTYDALYAHEHGVDRIILRAEPEGSARPAGDLVRSALEQILLRRHEHAQNFKLDDAAAKALERSILAVIRLLLIACGVLTLGVGGINIANVMFVAVAERTTEIGLRRALGETRRSILTQFLLEAGVLGLAGGAVGVAAGVAAVELGAFGLRLVFPHFPTRVEPWSIGAALAMALFSGVVAGLLPALRAARLDPVEALRAD